MLISAYARLPANTTAEEVYKVLALAVLVDLDTGIITEADCSMVTELARRHVARLMTGYDLNQGSADWWSGSSTAITAPPSARWRPP